MKENNLHMILKLGALIFSARNTYRIESVLGHGTFGITYTVKVIKGRDKNKTYALKEFFINGISSREESGIVSSCSDTISTEQCKAEFIAEAKNLIALNHPNIVKAYEVFEDNGTVYYTMDYIEGENLNSYLKQKSLTLDEAVKIITKIAYALSYMHESQHMLHLDLKPGNVMRRYSDGQIILIDFGLSRYFTDEDMAEGELPIGLGTKGYAPVEQSEYRNRKANFKATIDVYALGATFYKLLTGESPLPAKVLKAQPLLLTQKLHTLGLPEQKIQIVEKAMNPSPEKRYQSVMAFIYDINAEERQRRKRGCMLSFIITIIIVIVGVLSLYFYQRHQNSKQIYYKGIDEYAFELTESNHGANHYGENEYYKFFSDGTGLYLFESWHDPSDCDDSECTLEARTDTATFKYKASNNRIIFKKVNPCIYDGDISVTVDFPNKRIIVDEKDYPLRVNNESVNWDEINKIIGR